MDLGKQKCPMKVFITYQCNYYPLVWIIQGRKLNNRINKIHEKLLRLIYDNNIFTLGELPGIDNSMTPYSKSL